MKLKDLNKANKINDQLIKYNKIINKIQAFDNKQFYPAPSSIDFKYDTKEVNVVSLILTQETRVKIRKLAMDDMFKELDKLEKELKDL